MTISYLEALPLTEPLAVGLFRLYRPTGLYQWQFSHGADGRLAMELTNDHHLLLHSSEAVDHAALVPGAADPDANAMELRPGANGGIFLNGKRLATPDDPHLTLAGGSTLMPPGTFFVSGWPAGITAPGLLAAGGPASSGMNPAVAFGAGSVALGRSAKANYLDSVAIGYQAVAEWSGTAIGIGSYALQGTAIGGAHSEGASCAMGAEARAMSMYCTAVGASSYAGGGFHAVGLGGWATAAAAIGVGGSAYGVSSFAAAWGRADGEASISLGGYSWGYKSFSAASGKSWGDYSVTIGRGTSSTFVNQVVLGTYNALPPPSSGDPAPEKPLLVVGNGYLGDDHSTEYRSDAFNIRYDGSAIVQGGLTVGGTAVVRDNTQASGFTQVPAPSVFNGDVSVQGVLRVPELGDLSMGAFKAGTPP